MRAVTHYAEGGRKRCPEDWTPHGLGLVGHAAHKRFPPSRNTQYDDYLYLYVREKDREARL